MFRWDGPHFDAVAKVPLSSKGRPSAGSLSAQGAVIWSAGGRDMFVGTDGREVKRVANP